MIKMTAIFETLWNPMCKFVNFFDELIKHMNIIATVFNDITLRSKEYMFQDL